MRRSVVLAATAAIGLTAAAPAVARPASSMVHSTAAVMHTSGATDFSAARRHYRHYRDRGGGQAAAMSAFAGMVGVIGGIAAANARADDYGYDYGPAYYGPPPVYYGGTSYAAPYGGAPASGSYGYGGGTYVDPGGNIIPYQ